MSTPSSPTDNASAHNGTDPYTRSLAAYLDALSDDAVLGRLADNLIATTAVTRLGPTDALQTVLDASRLVVIGPPGSGKTTLLRVAGRRLADAPDGQRRRPGEALPHAAVPVYVDLATAREGEGVDDLVARTLTETAGRPLSPRTGTQLVLLVDNLDLATDVYLLEGLELLLRAGGRAGPAVVLSCREADWPAYRSWFEDVPTAELHPLSPLATTDALHESLPSATAAAAERWIARDRALASAVRSPLALGAFLAAVRDRPADRWRRAHVLDALLDALLSGIPSAERPAYRAALSDVALDSLGQGRLVEVDTIAMGLGVTRDDMIRTGAVVAHGSALAFVEPLLAQHCAASRLAERAAADPRRLAERLGDLGEPSRADTLVHVYHLAPDPVAFVLALLPLSGGPELAARCLTEPDAADPGGPSGGGAVVDALITRTPDIPAPTLYRLGEALVRAGEEGAAEVALRAALDRVGDGADLDVVFARPDIDDSPPITDWVRDFLAERNRGLALRGLSDQGGARIALEAADDALGRLGADLTFERGLSAAEEGDLPGALVAFESAVTAEPDRARYVYHYGRVLLALDRVEEAVTQLARARDLAPDRPQVEAALGEAYRTRGWLEEAHKSFEAATRLAPGHPAYEQLMGEVLAELGELEAGAAAMKHAVATQPGQAAWHDALGQVLAELGRWRAAMRAFRDAQGIEPDRIQYLRHLGRAHLALGETAASVETLARASEMAPEDPGVLSDLGRALAADGQSDAAIDTLRRALAHDDLWPADHLQMARLLRGEGQHDEALRHAQRAVDLAPASAAALAELGHAYDARGDHRQALAAYNRAVEQAPDDPETRRRAAAARRELGDETGAALDLQSAAALEPESPTALEQLARLHEENDDLARALEVLVEAALLAPDVADYHRRAGRLSLDLGRTEEAVTHYERAADLSADDPVVQHEFGRALRAAGHDERALGVLRRAGRLAPDDTAIQSDLAETARDLGRLNEASQAVNAVIAGAPDQASAHALSSDIEATLGNTVAAQAAMGRAVDLAPEDRAYRLRLADLCQPEDADAARQLLEQLAASEPDGDVARRLAALHVAEGEWDLAAEAYARAREDDPADPDLAAAHGRALREAGRPAVAVDVLERAWRADADCGAVLVELAATYEAVGRDRDALEAYGTASASGGIEPPAMVQWSRLATRLGALDVAIEAARQAVGARPDWADAYAALAEAYSSAGLMDSALTAMHRAAQLAPGEPAYREEEASLAVSLGRHGDAIAALEEGIAERPDAASLHYALGRAFEAQGWASEAAASFARAAELAPEEARYRRALAAYMAGDDLPGAIAALQRVVAQAPDDADACHQLGLLQARAGDDEAGLVQLQRAALLGPDVAEYHRALGECLTRLDRPGADDALRRSLALDPESAATHAALADLMARQGRFPAALDGYATAVRLAPESAEHWRALGTLRLARADAVGAAEALTEAVRLDPDSAESQVALGRALERIGRVAEAGACYRRAVRLAGDGPTGHLELGRARLAAGDSAGAITSLERAVALQPEDPDALALLASACCIGGRADDAVRYATRATELSPQSRAAWRALSEAHRAQGDLPAAVAALDEALALAPDDVVALAARAEMAEALGDLASALDAYDRLLVCSPGEVSAAVRYGELVANEGWLRPLVAPAPALPLPQPQARRAIEVLTLAADTHTDKDLGARVARALAVVRGRTGDADGAVAAAERSVALEERAPALLTLAWARLVGGEPEAAAHAAARARDLGAPPADALALLGQARQAMGEDDLAIDAYRGAVAAAPDDAALHAALGAAYEGLGQNEAALVAYRQAQRLAPEGGWARDLGRVAVAAGRPEAALEALEACADARPHDAEVQWDLAEARRASGDPDGARHALAAACKLAPNRADWQAALGDAHHTRGDVEAALSCYRRAAEAAPDVAAYRLAAAEAAAEIGATDEARGLARQVLDTSPDTVGAYLLLGRLAMADDDYGAAHEAFAAAVTREPADARLHYWLGLAAKSSDDRREALDHLETAARLDDTASETYIALGDLYATEGLVDDAIQAYQQAVVCAPEAVEPHLRLGVLCSENGLSEKALAHLQRASELAPDDFRPRYAMAQAYVRSQQMGQAVEAYEDALSKGASDPELMFDAGLAYKSLRDYGRAAAMFKNVTQVSPAHKGAYTQLAAVSALHFLDRVTPESGRD